MKRIIFLLVLFPVYGLANGWFQASDSMGLMHPTIALESSINSEEIYLRLGKDEYTAEVIYRFSVEHDWVTDSKMIFPVICYEGSRIQEIIEVRHNVCATQFSVEINNTGVDTNLIALDRASAMLVGYSQMKDIAAIAVRDEMDKRISINPDSTPYDPKIELHEFTFVPSQMTTENVIRVRYTAPYFNFQSGFSKTSFDNISNDVFYYDFSPAFTWSPDGIRELSITVDHSEVEGVIIFPEEFNFLTQNSVSTAKLKNLTDNTLKPLAIKIDQHLYKLFTNHTNASYDITSKTVSSELPGYPLAYLTDKDPETAWCTKESKPVITMAFSKGTYCHLEGLAIMNGYNKSRHTLLNNRSVETLSIELTDVETNQSKIIALDRPENPISYQNTVYLVATNARENEYSNQKILIPYQIIKALNEPEQEIQINILTTHPGNKYEDFCISEIYPVVNCG